MSWSGFTYSILWKVDRIGFSDDDLDMLINEMEPVGVEEGRTLYATRYDDKSLIVETVDF